ncbi:hypothetical protein AB5S17_22975, partial [Jiella sp. M17.18]
SYGRSRGYPHCLLRGHHTTPQNNDLTPSPQGGSRRRNTLQILWDEYRAVHPAGYGYSRFCELFRSFERRLSPTMRQEHVAGDKVFVDYSGKKIAIADPRTGEIREAELFIAVVCASAWGLDADRHGKPLIMFERVGSSRGAE